jgi:two-component system cell cycle sensor histidine kinase/response regulator CckA
MAERCDLVSELDGGGEDGGLTILVADDEVAIRRLVGEILWQQGFTVLEAADGVQALEVAEQHPGPIHLLLTDWCMPRLNGRGLIRGLRNGRPETAIVIMSSYIDGDSLPKAAFLCKPVTLQGLVETVSQVLEVSSSGRVSHGSATNSIWKERNEDYV